MLVTRMIRIHILTLLLCLPMVSLSAANAEDTAVRLAALGLENVRVTEQADEAVFAAFESTSYRGTFRGAAVGIEELGRLYPNINTFKVLLMENQMPQMALTATRVDGQWRVKGDYDYSEVELATSNMKRTNSSSAKIDITAYPMFTWMNHRHDVLCEYVVSLAPTVEASLWKGNRITLQGIIPVSYYVKSLKNPTYVRIGIADIAQDMTSRNGKWQATLAGGFFFFDRLGVDLRLAYHATRNLTIGAEASYTGEAVVNDGHYDISAPDKLSFLGKADFYEPYTRLQAQLMGGRFVYGDYGARLDVSRHLSDYTIGVYGILTGGENSAGFHFAIPLGPKRQMRKGAVRVKLPDYFDWEYSMDPHVKYFLEQMGEYIETRPDENRSAHYWQPVHVAQYAQRILNKNIK